MHLLASAIALTLVGSFGTAPDVTFDLAWKYLIPEPFTPSKSVYRVNNVG